MRKALVEVLGLRLWNEASSATARIHVLGELLQDGDQVKPITTSSRRNTVTPGGTTSQAALPRDSGVAPDIASGGGRKSSRRFRFQETTTTDPQSSSGTQAAAVWSNSSVPWVILVVSAPTHRSEDVAQALGGALGGIVQTWWMTPVWRSTRTVRPR